MAQDHPADTEMTIPQEKPAPPVEYPPLQGKDLVLGTFALSLATFMNVLDSMHLKRINQ